MAGSLPQIEQYSSIKSDRDWGEVAISPNGSHVASTDGRRDLSVHQVVCLAWFPSGVRFIACCEDGCIIEFQMSTYGIWSHQEVYRRVDISVTRPFHLRINACFITPRGAAIIGCETGVIEVLDTSGKYVLQQGITNLASQSVNLLACSSSGAFFIASCEGNVLRFFVRQPDTNFYVQRRQLVIEAPNSTIGPLQISISPADSHLALLLAHTAPLLYRLPENPAQASCWPTGPYVQLTGHSARVTSLAFSHDSQHVITASLDKTMKVWRVGDSAQPPVATASLRCAVLAMVLQPQCNLIASVDAYNILALWRSKPFANEAFKDARRRLAEATAFLNLAQTTIEGEINARRDTENRLSYLLGMKTDLQQQLHSDRRALTMLSTPAQYLPFGSDEILELLAGK